MVYKIITYSETQLDHKTTASLPKIEWLQSIAWEHECSNEISLLYVLKCVALVWFNAEKTISKEVDNDVFLVSSNNKSQVHSKNTKVSDIFAVNISFKKISVG